VQVLPSGLSWKSQRVAGFVFFPFGNVEALEAEVFYLMESMHQNYDSVMSMPSGRRRRFCDEKENLDKHRTKAMPKKGR
jgi:hypothetical protein